MALIWFRITVDMERHLNELAERAVEPVPTLSSSYGEGCTSAKALIRTLKNTVWPQLQDKKMTLESISNPPVRRLEANMRVPLRPS